jgi:acyl-CoA synthetase (AMP-forming)/AMP-acid ligase II
VASGGTVGDHAGVLKLLRRAELVVRRDATLGTIMSDLAAVHGHRRLVEESEGGLRISYRQAEKRVNRWAGGIAGKIEPGDRVVIATPNSYEMFLLCLAAARAGGIPVPINDRMRRDEIAHVVRDSGASMVVRSAAEIDGFEPLKEAAPADPADIGALFYTSGTTGKPKGAELTHRALVGNIAAAAAWPSRLHRDEAVFSLPIAHIMGFIVLMGYACAGVPVYLMRTFRPNEVIEAIERRRATIFVGVPAMFRLMLEAGAEEADLTSVRVWGSGADVMPPEVARRFKQLGASVTLPFVGALGEAVFAEGYGMVETAGGVAAKISPPLLDVGLGDSLGVSLPGYRMRVVDQHGDDVLPGTVGELWIKGPGVIRGYWSSPEATAQAVTDDGWLRTGDLARRGPLGTVVFMGRQKEVIKHGGYSVYASEVQQALEAHPAVLEAAVLGLADDRVGEIPVAAVRLTDGAELTELGLEAWMIERLADYKVPKRYAVVDELPRTGTAKVQKQQLRALFA